ncbi:MAG: hypothetical protein R3C19_08605 [Planctomycetaceae bacterium]
MVIQITPEKRCTGHAAETTQELQQQVRSFFERDFSRLQELIQQLQQPPTAPYSPPPTDGLAGSPARPDWNPAGSSAATQPVPTEQTAGPEARRTGQQSVPSSAQPPNRLAKLASQITDRIRAADSRSPQQQPSQQPQQQSPQQ